MPPWTTRHKMPDGALWSTSILWLTLLFPLFTLTWLWSPSLLLLVTFNRELQARPYCIHCSDKAGPSRRVRYRPLWPSNFTLHYSPSLCLLHLPSPLHFSPVSLFHSWSPVFEYHWHHRSSRFQYSVTYNPVATPTPQVPGTQSILVSPSHPQATPPLRVSPHGGPHSGSGQSVCTIRWGDYYVCTV